MDLREWAPRNGAPLTKVAKKYGWPVVSVVGQTVAYESGRDILWWEGSSPGAEILRELGLT